MLVRNFWAVRLSSAALMDKIDGLVIFPDALYTFVVASATAL